MWNVNQERWRKKHLEDEGFILTMWNVNMEMFEGSISNDLKVLF